METPEVNWKEQIEKIWVTIPKAGEEHPVKAWISSEPAREFANSKEEYHSAEPAELYRPTLAPIYGGETLTEALWSEMDRLMEGLMTGTDAEDGGDKFRAQATAWVIAITTNPYEPSVDSVRAEAMRRWNAAEAEANAQEEALNPDEHEPVGGSTLNAEEQD